MAVAYSGGRDSTALLHATARAARALGIGVVAMHVDHGLQASAAAWRAHCAATCARWASRGLPIRFASRTVAAKPAAGESVEAWARNVRYEALGAMAEEHAIDLVLLAHHRRDQAETFLLQALRGGGVAALAAMPRVAQRGGVAWARPWLHAPREAIDAYVRRHRLRFVDDTSNADDRFARNRLRRQVWPALCEAFDGAEAALAAAAGRVAQAAELVDEIAAADVATLAHGDNGSLDLTRWRALSPARRRAALRAWLRGEVGAPAPASLVDRLMEEAHDGRDGRWPVPGGEIRSYRGALHAVQATPARADLPQDPIAIDLSCPGVHAVPAWRGAFSVTVVEEGGVALDDARALVLRARAPGDRFQAGPRRPPRSLKLQYQANGVAPATRVGPVACRCGDGAMVFVAGLGIDARAIAPRGVQQVALAWQPDPPAAGRAKTPR